MAAMAWRVNEATLFQMLRQNKPTDHTEAKDILCVRQGFLYIWDSEQQAILSMNLNTWTQTDVNAASFVQTLRLTSCPVTKVHSLSLSLSGEQFALVGRRGVHVVGVGSRRGGESSVLCRCVSIGERLFSQVEVVQASWHPLGRLVVLSTDNRLRFYNATTGEEERCFSLGASSAFLRCLGDTAVAFDFGPVPTLAFVLRGNGDVYTLDTSCRSGSGDDRNRTLLRGPLTMHPPAEDNYGVDACALLCLPTVPPLLVIATTSGMIYHCLVLRHGLEEDGDAAAAAADPSAADVALYVYESVELSLTAPNVLESSESDCFTCPIRLVRDPTSIKRYHCSHAAGVHTVMVPFLNQLDDYLATNIESATLHYNDCIVEHHVCTKPLESSPLAPILGLAVVSDPQPYLICLTAELEAIVICLTSLIHQSPSSLLTNHSIATKSLSESKDSFDVHVKRLLRREISHPLLKSSAHAELSPEQSLQFVVRATQVLRAEYIHRLEVVHDEIQCRVQTLRGSKLQQEDALRLLRDKRSETKQKAEDLAEKHEDACDRQSHLVERVERVLRLVRHSLPSLSDAERTMLKELKVMQESLTSLQTSLEQVKVKQQFRQRHSIADKTNDQTAKGTLSEPRQQQLQEVLKKQSGELSQLLKIVADVKQELIL